MNKENNRAPGGKKIPFFFKKKKVVLLKSGKVPVRERRQERRILLLGCQRHCQLEQLWPGPSAHGTPQAFVRTLGCKQENIHVWLHAERLRMAPVGRWRQTTRQRRWRTTWQLVTPTQTHQKRWLEQLKHTGAQIVPTGSSESGPLFYLCTGNQGNICFIRWLQWVNEHKKKSTF